MIRLGRAGLHLNRHMVVLFWRQSPRVTRGWVLLLGLPPATASYRITIEPVVEP